MTTVCNRIRIENNSQVLSIEFIGITGDVELIGISDPNFITRFKTYLPYEIHLVFDNFGMCL